MSTPDRKIDPLLDSFRPADGGLLRIWGEPTHCGNAEATYVFPMTKLGTVRQLSPSAPLLCVDTPLVTPPLFSFFFCSQYTPWSLASSRGTGLVVDSCDSIYVRRHTVSTAHRPEEGATRHSSRVEAFRVDSNVIQQ